MQVKYVEALVCTIYISELHQSALQSALQSQVRQSHHRPQRLRLQHPAAGQLQYKPPVHSLM